jgi:hypothetical protein
VNGVAAPADTVEVRLLGAPIGVWAEAADRYRDLLREFTLLQFGHAEGRSVPERLLHLSEQLTGKYAGLTAANNALRDDAAAAGDQRIDLTYHVPVEVGDACRDLLQLLEEADEYCRNDQLLTLATPPTQVAFRRWYLNQFIDQIDGMPPTAWDGPLVCPVEELPT